MQNLISRSDSRGKILGAGALLVVVVLALTGVIGATESFTCPEGFVIVHIDKAPFHYCVEVPEDAGCDYGRNPEALWSDNPDGHPFERAFCDGLTEYPHKHPLDSLETEGLYCDEVPGCWAYGLTQDGHH